MNFHEILRSGISRNLALDACYCL